MIFFTKIQQKLINESIDDGQKLSMFLVEMLDFVCPKCFLSTLRRDKEKNSNSKRHCLLFCSFFFH